MRLTQQPELCRMSTLAFAQQYALVASARSGAARLLRHPRARPVRSARACPERRRHARPAGARGQLLRLLAGPGGPGPKIGRQRYSSQPCRTWRRCAPLFAAVDALVAEFAAHYSAGWQRPQLFVLPRQPQPQELTPLQLFTHTITHEFHHKGQVLSMSRLLGYVPVDTDVIRT